MIQDLITVGIIESRTIVRKERIKLIQSLGNYEVTIEAQNGSDMLNKLRAAKKQPDICITDITMPDMTAYDLVDEVNKKWENIRILILTDHDDKFCIREMVIKRNVNAYILTTNEVVELEQALIKLSSGNDYYPPYVMKIIKSGANSKEEPTARELQILKLSHLDITYQEMADELGVEKSTLADQNTRLFDKLKVHNRIALAFKAQRMGLIPAQISESLKYK